MATIIDFAAKVKQEGAAAPDGPAEVGTLTPVSAHRRKSERNSFPWYKRNAQDFFDGTRELSLEERAAYNDIIDLIYMRGGPLTMSDRVLAGKLVVDLRTWKRLKRRLIEAGKLILTDEGWLHNQRASEELADRQSSNAKRALRGRSPGDRSEIVSRSFRDPEKSPNENNDPCAVTLTDLESDGEEEERPVGLLASADADRAPKRSRSKPKIEVDTLAAFNSYNELALRLGLPQADKLTPGRRTKIGARIREHGGAEAWAKALANIEASSFLRGAKTDFRADLNFLLQPSKFEKVLDGSYADRAPVAAASVPDRANGVPLSATQIRNQAAFREMFQ